MSIRWYKSSRRFWSSVSLSSPASSTAAFYEIATTIPGETSCTMWTLKSKALSLKLIKGKFIQVYKSKDVSSSKNIWKRNSMQEILAVQIRQEEDKHIDYLVDKTDHKNIYN